MGVCSSSAAAKRPPAGFTSIAPGAPGGGGQPRQAAPVKPHPSAPTWDPSSGEAPKKYVRDVNGIMRVNPQYVEYMITQTSPQASPPPPINTSLSPQALPVATTMEDVAAMDEASVAAGFQHVPMSQETNHTIDHMQEKQVCDAIGVDADHVIDDIGRIFNKYEVPIGLLNKLYALSEYEFMEFIMDDSGSMSCNTDSVDPRTRRPMTRWQEAQTALKEMLEVLAHVPTPPMAVVFLNRKTVISFQHKGESPDAFLQSAYAQIDNVFRSGPNGSTPALERLQMSFDMHKGRRVARYFFGDGVPNGGQRSIRQISDMVKNRADPQGNPLTFISCTDEDECVEWMKEVEEVAPFTSECDDFNDEAREVLRDQGPVLPYSKGFHLICRIVAAMCPHDLDAMDESVPFSKTTLDNLLGVQANEQEYRLYFDSFCNAQRQRHVQSRLDRYKASYNWQPLFNELLRAPLASNIPAVQSFKQELKRIH